MAKSLNSEDNGAGQPSELGEDFFGIESERLGASRAASIKTISVAYCGMIPDRCRMLNEGKGGSLIIGRIGGTMMGIEQQVRNPEQVAKGEKPDYGTALVGNFNADVIGGAGHGADGEIMAEYADVGFCYLPGGFQEGVLTRFSKLTPEQQEAGMTFSLFIHAEAYPNMRGYRYMLTNAMRVDLAMADMRRRMQQEAILVARDSNRQLALPAR